MCKNLNVSSATAATVLDQTARARIRDVAIARFGAEGFAAVSIRTIAAEAGVSPGLVIHHFGDKDGLRRACDDRVLEFVHAKVTGSLTDGGQIVAQLGEVGPYLARMVSDGSAAGEAFFDELVNETRLMVEQRVADGAMRDLGDPSLVALVLAIHALAPLLLRAHVARWAAVSGEPGSEWTAIAGPLGEIYARGLFAASAASSTPETETRS